MSVSFDQFHDLLQEKMDMQRNLHDAEKRLASTLRIIRRYEWGTSGFCLECAQPISDGHTKTCVIGIAVQWNKKTS